MGLDELIRFCEEKRPVLALVSVKHIEGVVSYYEE